MNHVRVHVKHAIRESMLYSAKKDSEAASESCDFFFYLNLPIDVEGQPVAGSCGQNLGPATSEYKEAPQAPRPSA